MPILKNRKNAFVFCSFVSYLAYGFKRKGFLNMTHCQKMRSSAEKIGERKKLVGESSERPEL